MGKVYFLIALAIIELIAAWIILLYFIAPAAFPEVFGKLRSIFKRSKQ
jgi:hypothetical protein